MAMTNVKGTTEDSPRGPADARAAGGKGKRRGALAAGLAIVVSAVAWLAFWGTPARAEEATRFAAAMPAGALVYLEFRDLSGGLKTWLASPMRDRYFKSASYRSFRRSRLYLKLQDRLADLQKGFGMELTEERLAQLAGGPSAVAIYDPGKLELVFVTEVGRQQAGVASFLASLGSFQERRTAKGALYYTREVTTDGGRLAQQIAVAHAEGRLWLATSAALLADALDGAPGGGLAPAVAETVRHAPDFKPHDVVFWVDHEKASRNKYFGLYWVQRNAPELSGIVSGLIDLELAPGGVRERRWFVLREPARGAGDGAALARLQALAPADAQLVEASAAADRVAPALAETLFGEHRRAERPGSVSLSNESVLAEGAEEAEDDSRRPVTGRYRHLDERFERDVDDPALARAKPAAAGTAAEPQFADRLSALLAPAQPARFAAFGSIDYPQGDLFARFRRGVVVELGAPDRFDARAFEALIAAEFGRRFVVGGDASKAAWADADGARAIAGALIPQGGAYRLSGAFLIVARDPAECASVAARVAQPAPPASGQAGAGVLRLAEVRLDAGRQSFARLTRVLDAGAVDGLHEEVSDAGEEGESRRPVLFFSENIASLLDVAREVSRVRVVTSAEGVLLRDEIEYVWGGA
jgi:hypothetical protein